MAAVVGYGSLIMLPTYIFFRVFFFFLLYLHYKIGVFLVYPFPVLLPFVPIRNLFVVVRNNNLFVNIFTWNVPTRGANPENLWRSSLIDCWKPIGTAVVDGYSHHRQKQCKDPSSQTASSEEAYGILPISFYCLKSSVCYPIEMN